jgi:cytochrome bd-type quinol oxidase subunit 2
VATPNPSFEWTKVLLLVVTVVSALLAVMAVAGAIYIAYSLLTQAWYRETFLAYAVKLIVLYGFFALGIAAAATVGLRFPKSRLGHGHPWLWGAILAGVVAAALLEFTFWSDLNDHFAHGVVFLPFIGWAFVATSQRQSA